MVKVEVYITNQSGSYKRYLTPHEDSGTRTITFERVIYPDEILFVSYVMPKNNEPKLNTKPRFPNSGHYGAKR